jgi:hypothetical protein
VYCLTNIIIILSLFFHCKLDEAEKKEVERVDYIEVNDDLVKKFYETKKRFKKRGHSGDHFSQLLKIGMLVLKFTQFNFYVCQSQT